MTTVLAPNSPVAGTGGARLFQFGHDARPIVRQAPNWTRRPLEPSIAHDSGTDAFRQPDLAPAGHGYGQPLGSLLSQPGLAILEASESKMKARLQTQLKSNKLDHIAKGKEIGSGNFKTAYEIPGTDNVLLVAKPWSHSFSSEILNLDRLRNTGMPVARFLEIGNYKGNEALVMPRYDAVFRMADPKTAEGADFVGSPLVRPRTIDDLVKIRDIVRNENIIVDDLQYGIDKKGCLFVMDPIEVDPSTSRRSNREQLHKLDANIAALRKRFSN